MNCPSCTNVKTECLDTRAHPGLTVRKRRCPACSSAWSTQETVTPGTLRTPSPAVSIDAAQQLPVARGGYPSPPVATGRKAVLSDLISGSDQNPIRSSRSSGSGKGERDGGGNTFDWAHGNFDRIWSAAYGMGYKSTPADRSQLGRLLRSLTPEEAKELPDCFSRYVADGSHFVAGQKRHSLAWFCTDGGFNKYRTKARANGQRDVTRGSVPAPERYVPSKGDF